MKIESLKYFLLALLILIIALFFILPDNVSLSPGEGNACEDAIKTFLSSKDSCKKGFFIFKNNVDKCNENKCLLEKINPTIEVCCDYSPENNLNCENLKSQRKSIIDNANLFCEERVCFADINVCTKFASLGDALCRILQNELRCPGCTSNPDQNADPLKCQETKSKLEKEIETLRVGNCKECYPELNYGNAFNCCIYQQGST